MIGIGDVREQFPIYTVIRQIIRVITFEVIQPIWQHYGRTDGQTSAATRLFVEHHAVNALALSVSNTAGVWLQTNIPTAWTANIRH